MVTAISRRRVRLGSGLLDDHDVPRVAMLDEMHQMDSLDGPFIFNNYFKTPDCSSIL